MFDRYVAPTLFDNDVQVQTSVRTGSWLGIKREGRLVAPMHTYMHEQLPSPSTTRTKVTSFPTHEAGAILKRQGPFDEEVDSVQNLLMQHWVLMHGQSSVDERWLENPGQACLDTIAIDYLRDRDTYNIHL